jgi:hypothetical protein
VRTRNGQPVVGTATARPVGGDVVSFPFYGPWGYWFPWYTGWDLGFYGYYNPWRYGATRWYYNPWGMWYDPFTYDPYYYGDYGRDYEDEKEPETMGSLRIKANVDSAKVYIDGALVGTVDEFNGLKSYLENVDGGRRVIELRAEGYETFKGEVDVKVGSVTTFRASLKKLKK